MGRFATRPENALRIILVTLLVLGCASVSAQVGSPKLEIAKKLVELANLSAVVAGSADATADAMLAQNPMLRPYKMVIIEWFDVAFLGGRVETEMAEIYAESFSESELREIVAFHETPTGQKLVRLQPELMRKGGELGRRIGEQNSGLLQKMIEERTSELERIGR